MQIAGMIIEYNPLHSGHLRLLAEIRERLGAQTPVIGVMSGNFVQRGEFSLLRKHVRAQAAVESGVDLVLELPLPWAVASAERFADGGIQVLAATGMVTHLAFGSESGDAAALWHLAQVLMDPAWAGHLRRELGSGISFAQARQRAAACLTEPAEAAMLQDPNNLLGVEYCKALLRRSSAITPLTVRRVGAGYHETISREDIPSAAQIRALLRAGEREGALSRMAPAMARLYEEEERAGRAPVFDETSERAMLARLRSMDLGAFAALDEGREGLYRRLYAASREAASLRSVLESAKTRRYAYARLRRMTLWAYLGLTPGTFPAQVPYLRVLAAGERGRLLLARMRGHAALPVLTKPADVRRLPDAARDLFDLEVRATDLYTLAYPQLSAACGGTEWREGPAIL